MDKSSPECPERFEVDQPGLDLAYFLLANSEGNWRKVILGVNGKGNITRTAEVWTSEFITKIARTHRCETRKLFTTEKIALWALNPLLCCLKGSIKSMNRMCAMPNIVPNRANFKMHNQIKCSSWTYSRILGLTRGPVTALLNIYNLFIYWKYSALDVGF